MKTLECEMRIVRYFPSLVNSVNNELIKIERPFERRSLCALYKLTLNTAKEAFSFNHLVDSQN